MARTTPASAIPGVRILFLFCRCLRDLFFQNLDLFFPNFPPLSVCDLTIIRDWPSMATAPTCWEWWGLTNRITITMLPMIMKTIISLLIWPSTPLMTSGGRVGEEKSVLNLGLDIFGFRIFYDMRLLSPALASEGRCEWDMESRAKCQPISPLQITFVFYRKFSETRLRLRTGDIDLDTKNTNPNTLQLGDYRNRHWLRRFTFFNPLFGIS